MKIHYEMQTPWPTDVPNPHRFEALDWTQEGTIPFVPMLGIEIDPGDGDLHTVRNVYWSALEPDRVTVYFEEDMDHPLEYWTRGGWQTKDLPVAKPKRAKA